MTVFLTRRSLRKAQDAASQAKAQSDANKAVLAALAGHSGPERLRRADAILDAAITAHAAIHGADVTAPKLSATSGRIFPSVDRSSVKDAAEAVFKTGRAVA